MTVTIDHRRARDGSGRLQRHWAPAGAPDAAMVLVHGLSEHTGRYDHVGTALAARGIDVVACDLPGHGGSSGPRGHVDRFDRILDDVEDLIGEQRGLGVPLTLFGHSLGGLIALVYAESERPPPDLLALSAPALATTLPRVLQRMAVLFSRTVPRLMIPSALDPDGLSRDPEVGRAYAADPMRLTKTSARFGAEALAAMEWARAHVDRVTVPVWVVHGGDDHIVPTDSSAVFATRPNAVRHVRAGLRHESLNEPEGPEILDELATWVLSGGRIDPAG